MTAGFGSRSLFPAHRRRCKNDFRDLCHALQLQIDEELEGYAQGILANVHILEEENAVLENERSPELKERVKAQLEDVKIELAKMYKIFD